MTPISVPRVASVGVVRAGRPSSPPSKGERVAVAACVPPRVSRPATTGSSRMTTSVRTPISGPMVLERSRPVSQLGRDSTHETSMTVRRRLRCVMCTTSSPTSSPMSSVPIMAFREDTFSRTWTSTHIGTATATTVQYSIPFSAICVGAGIRVDSWSSSSHLRRWRWQHRSREGTVWFKWGFKLFLMSVMVYV